MDDELLADLNDLGEEEPEIESVNSTEPVENIEEAVDSLTEIYHSKQLEKVLEKIQSFDGSKSSEFYSSGPVEQVPEYQLIVQSNNFLVELENEISLVHKKLQDLYAPRFPELESILPNPKQYAQVVRLMGNETV
jgi:U4/U6 small nuclear ribonucleoprotein PRP31